MIIEEGDECFLKIGICGKRSGNTIWLADVRKNGGLYKLDIETKMIEFVIDFPCRIGAWAFSDIIFVEDKLYFVPYCGCKQLIIYEVKQKQFQIIHIKGDHAERYVIGVRHKESIYLIPEFGKRIARINIKNSKVTYIEEPLRRIKKDLHLSTENLFYSYYMKDDTIYLPMYEKKILIEYIIDTGKISYYYFEGNEKTGFYDCANSNDVLYLLDRCGTIYEFGLKTKESRRLFFCDQNIIDPYMSIQLYNEELWLIPNNSDAVAVYNIKNESFKYPDLLNADNHTVFSEDDLKIESKFSKVFCYEKKLLLYPWGMDTIIEIDMKSGKADRYDSYLPPEKDDTILGLLRKRKKYISEQKKIKKQKNFGREIWNSVSIDG